MERCGDKPVTISGSSLVSESETAHLAVVFILGKCLNI